MNNCISKWSITSAILLMVASASAQPQPRPRTSPHETISTILQGNYQSGPRLMIVYGRPYSKAPNSNEIRKIWGGVVPFDKVWRTGADEATTLITPLALEMGDKTIPAGVYTIWTWPAADGSAKLIINKKFGVWGLDPNYDQNEDLARIDLKKDTIENRVDQFTMALDGNANQGFTLKMSWENIQYSVPFSVKK